MMDYREREYPNLEKGHYSTEAPAQTIPFGDYYELAIRQPRIAQSSHERIKGLPLTDQVQERIAEYFASALVRNRILTLVGDFEVTTSVTDRLKRGLEEYTRTPQGVVYAIKGCPI